MFETTPYEAIQLLKEKIKDQELLKLVTILEEERRKNIERISRYGIDNDHLKEVLQTGQISIYEKQIKNLKDTVKYWEDNWACEVELKRKILNKFVEQKNQQRIESELSEGIVRPTPGCFEE